MIPENFVGRAMPLTAGGLTKAAEALGVDEPVVLAIIQVETSGCGFCSDKRPKILFERHVFHKWTNGIWDTTHPHISAVSPGGYSDSLQYAKLHEAMALHEEYALYSVSWGLGQIMGFNFRAAGYGSVSRMVEAFCDSEDEQLGGIVDYCLSRGLDGDLRRHNWQMFAFGYNGSAYATNHYDKKLEAAYRKHRDKPIDLAVRAQQVALYFAGLLQAYNIDGIKGPITLAALDKMGASI